MNIAVKISNVVCWPPALPILCLLQLGRYLNDPNMVLWVSGIRVGTDPSDFVSGRSLLVNFDARQQLGMCPTFLAVSQYSSFV